MFRNSIYHKKQPVVSTMRTKVKGQKGKAVRGPNIRAKEIKMFRTVLLCCNNPLLSLIDVVPTDPDGLRSKEPVPEL